MPVPMRDVNTDLIIPQRYLRSIMRTGFADALFANVRYLADGVTPDPAFVLNFPRYAGASILVAYENFGCGSSREHAPWALGEYGFRVLIAPGFADIFANNSANNGLLTITLPAEQIETLIVQTETTPGYRLAVDLPAQTVTAPDGTVYPFAIDAYRKESLLLGLDPIGRTLQYADDIHAYEVQRKSVEPWLFA